MGINIYNIKKWTRMLTGKSILHVDQPIGRVYCKNEIKGYYNDLTQKVLKSNLNKGELPKTEKENGKYIEFPIAIFQYGLGAYDLYLMGKEEKYLKIFSNTIKWTINNQLNNGGWEAFKYESPENPFSSMAQGEGASLLIRGYKQFGDQQYLEAAKKAIYFMVKKIEESGTTQYYNNEIYLKEFANEPVVLNGWIFSIFGLYDYLLVNKEEQKIKEIYNATIKTLIKELNQFDLKYWSKYDIKNKVASPFYHHLHIQLLRVLNDLTGEEIFEKFAKKFEFYEKNKIYKTKAFCIKAIQKIKEK